MTAPIDIFASPDGMSVTMNGQTFYLPGNTWSTNADGSVTFNGSIWFPAGTDTASGAGIVVFGPGGGRAAFPAVQPGPPGPATQYAFTMVQVAYGTPLPPINPAVVPTQWDANNIPTALNVTFYVNAGAPGAPGGTMILTATDLTGSPAAGMMIGYDSDENTAQWQKLPLGEWNYAEGILANPSTTVQQKSIGTGIKYGPYTVDTWPYVDAQIEVVGAPDVRVNLVARINGPSGEICSLGVGQPGAAPPLLHSHAYGLGPGSANIIPAGQTATIFLYAEAQSSSPNAWSTTTNCTFAVKGDPVPS
jgi:hypothetical protein